MAGRLDSPSRLPRKKDNNKVDSNLQHKPPEDVVRGHVQTPSRANPKPYTGLNKLVVGFNIGTTNSGISYRVLQLDRIPESPGVTRLPERELFHDDTSIPSLLYYDKNGKVRAAGDEVLSEGVTKLALAEGWTKAEWWMLHLLPDHLTSSVRLDFPPLPPGKSSIDVLTDFIKHLFHSAQNYIQERHPSVWGNTENSIKYIFMHPNGWGGMQQQLCRRAIERAGLVPSTPEGQSRIRLLPEGEANLHSYVTNHLSVEATDEATPQRVVIVNAGDATIDLSMFSITSNPMISCEEIALAECRLQGSVFVTGRAKVLLKQKLAGWEDVSEEKISECARELDLSTIKSDQEPTYIRVANHRYNNSQYDIKNGKLKLSGEEVTNLFKDTVDAIKGGFEQLPKFVKDTTVFLVGDLSTSGWLWSQLQSYFKVKNIQVFRTENDLNKAVALGAVISDVNRENRLVTSRIARATYGVVCAVLVDKNNEEHVRRKDQWQKEANGDHTISGYIQIPALNHFVAQGDPVPEGMKFREGFFLTGRKSGEYGIQELRLVYYPGNPPAHQWLDQVPLSTMCTIRANLGSARKDVVRRGPLWRSYYELEYDVAVYFESGELRACLEWKTRDGRTEQIPAEILYR